MYRVLTAAESRSIEMDATQDNELTLAQLMWAAGMALASVVEERVPEGAIAVFAGPGNNGGDGWVAAQHLHQAGRVVRVYTPREPSALSGEAFAAASSALEAGVEWECRIEPPEVGVSTGVAGIVDALLGIGLSGEPRQPIPAWIAAINASDSFVLSADIPTGVDSDTGRIPGAAVRADATVTFSALKRGLVLLPGAEFAGEVVIADVGVPTGLIAAVPSPEIWTAEEYRELVPRHAPDVHKNGRGRLLIVAGSSTYSGAAVLAARAAVRCGTGYVTLAVPSSIVPIAQGYLLTVPVVGLPCGRTGAFSSAALKILLRLALEFDAVVLGPGITLADGAVVTARGLIERLSVPLVVDADGLNALVDAGQLLDSRSGPTVLTPHPGELARLLSVTSEQIQADRLHFAAQLAGPDRAVVLKGAGTITSNDAHRVINTSGTPALATAGTGDVLAGIVGGLLAQGLSPLDAGALGAYVHGKAGEAAAEHLTPICVTAEDVIEYLPAAFGELLR